MGASKRKSCGAQRKMQFSEESETQLQAGGRLVKHAWCHCLLVAEGHLSRRLSGSMLRMIAVVPLPDGWRTRTREI
jgi:hypothetical protein